MARGIVQSRPFIKQRRPHSSFSMGKVVWFSRNKKMKKSEFLSFFLQKYIAIIALIILLLFLVIFVLKGTWYNPSYQIQTIDYPPTTRAKYENTELFVLTSKYLRGRYYSALQIGGESELLTKIREQYPFVAAVQVEYRDTQTVAVDFEFVEPDFLVKVGEKRFGIWQGWFYEELDPARSLGNDWFLVDTPQYLSGTSSLSGFFYEVDYWWYREYLPLIQKTFPEMNRFVYLAGSPNFIIFENNKRIYLHKERVTQQLEKYRWLKKYFANFEGVYEIDLGSLTEDKAIIQE